MQDLILTQEQRQIVDAPIGGQTFLEGLAGSGKTIAAVKRLMKLLHDGIPASSILILVPQRLLARPYLHRLRSAEAPPGGQVTTLSLGGLARRMVELYWPLISEAAGFSSPDHPPTFLGLETAQYYMAEIVRPYLDQGYFSNVTLQRSRLYSQILDNLNKAAVVGFPHSEIGDRLTQAWAGDPGFAACYQQAQECASRFRALCYERNLLDYSLQVEVFRDMLWGSGLAKRYLVDQYRYIIAENLEEDVPVAHDIIAEWIPDSHEALLIYDQGGGFRRFLGADPEDALALKDRCERQVVFDQIQVPSPALQSFARRLENESRPRASAADSEEAPAFHYAFHRYFPEMLDWVATSIHGLMESGVPPGEIVVLAPFLGDALRFALSYRLEGLGVGTYSIRPSRALLQEPAARCLLSIAALCHPEWSHPPPAHDLAQAFALSMSDLDPVRARLLVEILYRPNGEASPLAPFGQLRPEMKSRISYDAGERYEGLRQWIDEYRSGEPQMLDHLLSRLYGEALSQPGYGFHTDFDAGVVAGQLIHSVREFRQSVGEQILQRGEAIGRAYVRLAEESVVGLQRLPQPQDPSPDRVLLSPAYTFLMNNRPVDHQFWLNIGGRGWSERLYQPLTHPYVLSRQWNQGAHWTDRDEVRTRQNILQVLTQALLRRCRKGVYLGISELGESGSEARGPLLIALQRILLETPSRHANDL